MICGSAKVTPPWLRGLGLRLFLGVTLARTTWVDMMDTESGTPCAKTWEACCCLDLRMAVVPLSVVSDPYSCETQCLSHSFCPTTSCLQLLEAFTYVGFSSQLPCLSSMDTVFLPYKLGSHLCVQKEVDSLINIEEWFFFFHSKIMNWCVELKMALWSHYWYIANHIFKVTIFELNLITWFLIHSTPAHHKPQ